MINMKIFIRNHCAATIILTLANNMNARNIKRIRITHDCADIKIMRQIFDSDF